MIKICKARRTIEDKRLHMVVYSLQNLIALIITKH